jgi:hypothetical protein
VLTTACLLRPSNSQLKENWSPNIPPSLTKRSGNSTHEWPKFKDHRSYFWNHLLTIGNSIVWTQLNRPLVTYNGLLRSSKCLPNHVTASVMHSSILWWTFSQATQCPPRGKTGMQGPGYFSVQNKPGSGAFDQGICPLPLHCNHLLQWLRSTPSEHFLDSDVHLQSWVLSE